MTSEETLPPEPSMTSKETQHPELSVQSSSLLREVTSLPLIQSLGSLYTTTRDSHWALKSGLGMIEDTCSMILNKLHIDSAVAIQMDKTAGEGVTKLKERYPSITTPTEEMVKSSKDSAAFVFHKTIRRLFRTYPGHTVLNFFDWSVDKADRLLRRLSPPVRSPCKRKVTRASVKKMQMQKEHAYASEDSGTCESTEKLQKEQKPTEVNEKKEDIPIGLMYKIFRLGVVFPMEVSVLTLKRVRRYLHAVSQKKRKLEKSKDFSPEKEREIEARRKISPRKKKSVSLLDQVRRSAFSVLGYKDVRVRHIEIEKAESDIPNREEVEKKRKHEEILTDQGSDESNDDDLADFDLDNYESEEDPDYEPSDSDVISEDISDAETESDIETEKVDEPGFVQLKEKPEDKLKEPPKPQKPDEKPPPEKPKDSKTKSPRSEKIPEPSKDKVQKPDEKSSELPKDAKSKASHSEKNPEPSKDKAQKPDEKSSELPKDAKSKAYHSEKNPEPSKDKKAQKPDEKSSALPKDTTNKPPQSDKIPEPVMNGEKKQDSADKNKPSQADKIGEMSKEKKGKAAVDHPPDGLNSESSQEDKPKIKFGKFFKE